MTRLGNRPAPDDIRGDPESTFDLLERAHAGDRTALDALFSRYLRPLERWTSGRLPAWARSAADTQDVVQDTLLNAFKNLGGFEPRHEGAFQAYLRQAVMNQIRDRLRRTAARPRTTLLDEDEHLHPSSPLEDAMAKQTFERYEAALTKLDATQREAIIGRFELGCSYEELATAMAKPSADAVRKVVSRALVHLVEEMQRERRR
jgi:RNA polymerase sigma factor (sigma-70 family)